MWVNFFFQAEDGIRDDLVTGSSDVCSSDLVSAMLLILLTLVTSDLNDPLLWLQELNCKGCDEE